MLCAYENLQSDRTIRVREGDNFCHLQSTMIVKTSIFTLDQELA